MLFQTGMHFCSTGVIGNDWWVNFLHFPRALTVEWNALMVFLCVCVCIYILFCMDPTDFQNIFILQKDESYTGLERIKLSK